MCALLWSEARALYTNDTQRLYSTCQDLSVLLGPQCFEGPMYAYLEWLHVALHYFNEILLPFANVKKDLGTTVRSL